MPLLHSHIKIVASWKIAIAHTIGFAMVMAKNNGAW
jgi:hypothetical protein